MRPLVAPIGLMALAACGAAPAPPPPPADVKDAGPPVAAAPLDACVALRKPLRTLQVLAAEVSLGRSMPVRPLRPELLVRELDADAARARAIATGDAELSKLAADAAARLDRIAGGARALAAAERQGNGEAARTTLLEEMERGELIVALVQQRCGGSESVAGHIPASALQRAVRAGAGAFKKCYEPALRRDPDLHGTVRVRFTVARDGTVSEAADADHGEPDPLAWGKGANTTPLGDPGVVACVLAAFQKLAVPRPEGGTFSATYAVELGSVR